MTLKESRRAACLTFVFLAAAAGCRARNLIGKVGGTDAAVADGGAGGIGVAKVLSLRAAMSYEVRGEHPAVATGDLNGDGKEDLAVVSETGNVGPAGGGTGGVAGGEPKEGSVSVLLNKGDGTFAAPVNYPVGQAPSDVALADLNGDGKADLAVANHSGGVSVLLNDGGGAFAPHVSYVAGAGPISVSIGDVNADGRPDLAVANDGDGSVSVLVNIGGGAFALAVNTSAGGIPTSVALGDLNGDGKVDLAVANSVAGPIVFGTGGNVGAGGIGGILGSGGGHVDGGSSGTVGNAGVGGAAGTGKMGGSVGAAGAGGAGGAHDKGSVSVLLNAGNGVFAAAVSYPTAGNSHSVAIGDLNGDGNSDLAVANGRGDVNPRSAGTGTGGTGTANPGINVGVLLNAGNGTFAPVTSYPAGGNPYAVAIGDLDGDGKPDLAVVNATNEGVSVLLNNGTGVLAPSVRYADGDSPRSVALGDLNGDGRIDMAVGGGISVSVLLSDGADAFVAGLNYPAGDATTVAMAVGDLDGDGKPDLVLPNYNSGGGVIVLVNAGNGAFADAVSYPTAGNSYAVAIGDLNGDGKPDLAVVIADGVSVLLNKGGGTFAAPASYGSSGPNQYSVAIADVNGDGKADLVLANAGGISPGSVMVLINEGAGTFADEVAIASNVSPVSVAVGDVNGDGKVDVVFASPETNNVGVIIGQGNGRFAPVTSYGAGRSPNAVALGDLSGDGRADLAVANVDAQVSVLLNMGTGTFSGRTTFPSGGVGTSIVLPDLNDDGRADLVFSNYDNGSVNVGSGNVSVLLNQGNGTFATPVIYAAGCQPAAVVAGDLNGDGRVDLAIANNNAGFSSGNVTVFLNTSH